MNHLTVIDRACEPAKSHKPRDTDPYGAGGQKFINGVTIFSLRASTLPANCGRHVTAERQEILYLRKQNFSTRGGAVSSTLNSGVLPRRRIFFCLPAPLPTWAGLLVSWWCFASFLPALRLPSSSSPSPSLRCSSFPAPASSLFVFVSVLFTCLCLWGCIALKQARERAETTNESGRTERTGVKGGGYFLCVSPAGFTFRGHAGHQKHRLIAFWGCDGVYKPPLYPPCGFV